MIRQQIGRYEIRGKLGQGGMASVYLAYDPNFAREVALKLLPPQFLHDPTFRKRFEQEARTIASLEHLAVVPVYDFGEDNGLPFLVMRLMTGGSLADRLANGALSLAEAARILAALAPTLDEAHRLGIIHRDLKPPNILFDQHNMPRIADFGIAKLTQATQSFTTSGVIGTPQYMSPEQWDGLVLDGRCDVYAQGVIVFQMLTAQCPYEGTTPSSIMKKHLMNPVPNILLIRRDLPVAIQPIIEQAMAKERNNRYPTTSAFSQALQSLVTNTAVPPTEKRPHTPTLPNWHHQPPISPPHHPTNPPPHQPTAPQTHTYPAKSDKPSKERWLLGALAVLGVTLFSLLIIIAVSLSSGTDNLPADAIAEAPTEVIEAPLPTETLVPLTETPLPTQTLVPPLPTETLVPPTETLLPPVPPANTPSLGIGSTQVSQKDGMTMVYVPPGEFLMGSTDDDEDAWDEEKPQHTVYLDAYWIDQTEVTNEMFTRFVAETGHQTEAEKEGTGRLWTEEDGWHWVDGTDWQHPQGAESSIDGLEKHPVVQVSWNDATAYCEWAGRRLPTEAEWEKAARGVDGQLYPWGNDEVTGNRANFCDSNCPRSWADESQDDGYQFTAPVGSYPAGASLYGTLDMSGNVWEWVNDWFDADYYTSSPSDSPLGALVEEAADSPSKVLRGGSWHYEARPLRGAFRYLEAPATRTFNVGVRCSFLPVP